MRKRVLLHFLFWFVYLFQDILLQYTWMSPYLATTPVNKQIWMAVETGFLILPPKLFLVYYLFYIAGKKILHEKTNKILLIAEIIVAIAISLIVYRLLFYYYLNPIVYKIPVTDSAVFSIRTTLVSFLEMGFVTGLAITLKSLRIQLSGKEREKNLVREKLETELKFLRNQTSPHFLMNTLNNIYALARKKSDDTEEVVMKLSELLRFILYESSGPLIPLNDEIKVLEDYLELETIRYNERLTVTFTKEIDNDSYQVTPLLLLSFVENAFKHGISESRFESFVHIDMKVNDGNLTFTVENTNENSRATAPESKIGLRNVRRQLELTYRQYSLDVQDRNNVFMIHLYINLNNHVEI